MVGYVTSLEAGKIGVCVSCDVFSHFAQIAKNGQNHVPKLNVVGSIPITRSRIPNPSQQRVTRG